MFFCVLVCVFFPSSSVKIVVSFNGGFENGGKITVTIFFLFSHSLILTLFDA